MASSRSASSSSPACKMPKTAPVVQPPEAIPPSAAFKPAVLVNKRVSNVSLSFPSISPSTTRDRVTSLLAAIQVADPEARILPRDPSSNDNPIVKGSHFPVASAELLKYMTKPSEGRNTIQTTITLKTNMRVAEIKLNNYVYSHIRKFSIWIKPNALKCDKVVGAAWIHHVNPNHTSQHKLKELIQKKLPEEFGDFQISRRNIQYFPDRSLLTNAWCIEVDSLTFDTQMPLLLEFLPLDRPFGAVPINTSKHDNNKTLSKVFISQNSYLHATSAISIDNLKALLTTIPLTDGTYAQSIKEQLLEMKNHDGETIFLGVSQFNSKRASFLCKKTMEIEARALLVDFIDTYLLEQVSPDADQLCEKDPKIIGGTHVPEQISHFYERVNNSDNHTLPPNPRKRTQSSSYKML